MYLITGASGFLGSAVIKNLLETTEESILALSRTPSCFAGSPRVEAFLCDVRDYQRLKTLAQRLDNGRGVKILCLAASHNMDFVEENPDEASQVNLTALKNIVDYFHCFDSLFFASTDAVYGEGESGYRHSEADTPLPVSEYGRQKLKCEKIVKNAGGKALRLPYMYGKSLTPSRPHFADNIIDRLSRGEAVSLFTDVIRSALDYNSAARIILKLFSMENADLPPVMNLCGDEALSRYDIGIKIAEDYSLDKGLLLPCKAADGKALKARRALNGAMDNSLLKATLGVPEIRTAKI